MSTHDYLLLAAVIINIVITSFGFVKILVGYEHRFTKLETEMMMLIKLVNERDKDKTLDK